jgi:hypothetical protein
MPKRLSEMFARNAFSPTNYIISANSMPSKALSMCALDLEESLFVTYFMVAIYSIRSRREELRFESAPLSD